MKKFISLIMICVLSFTMLVGCPRCGCAENRNITIQKNNEIKTVHAVPYGLFDRDENKIDGVKYTVSAGNVILGIIFFETVFVPIIIFGWYLYEPSCAENR